MASMRLPLVDRARGLALWAMLLFHLIWDLAQFGWIDAETPSSQAFHWFGHAIAVSFLLLVGYSLVLAATPQLPLWRSAQFWRRWGLIALSAAAISAVSFWLFPASPIFFGILHCIAVSILIALPFTRAPAVLALGCGALAWLAPHFFASVLFDAKILWWTGLGTFQPPSNDYRPLLPWLAFVLFGVALGRWTSAGARAPHPCDERQGSRRDARRSTGYDDAAIQQPQAGSGLLRAARNDNPLLGALQFCGRHSLAFYLIHQPLLFGLFSLLGLFVTPNPDARLFLRQCAVQCVNQGVEAGICENSCACVVARAKKAGLWLALAQDRLTPQQKSAVHDEAVACYAEASGK